MDHHHQRHTAAGIRCVRRCVSGGFTSYCCLEENVSHELSVCVCVRAGVWLCSVELSRLRHRPGSNVAIVEVGLQTDLQVYLQLTQTWIILRKSVCLVTFQYFGGFPPNDKLA